MDGIEFVEVTYGQLSDAPGNGHLDIDLDPRTVAAAIVFDMREPTYGPTADVAEQRQRDRDQWRAERLAELSKGRM